MRPRHLKQVKDRLDHIERLAIFIIGEYSDGKMLARNKFHVCTCSLWAISAITGHLGTSRHFTDQNSSAAGAPPSMKIADTIPKSLSEANGS